MNESSTILTLAGAMLALIGLVVKYFIGAMTKKDDQIIRMVTEFNATVSNHMEHQTGAFKQLSRAIDNLTKEIKRNNGVKSRAKSNKKR